eukprot:g458.t1
MFTRRTLGHPSSSRCLLLSRCRFLSSPTRSVSQSDVAAISHHQDIDEQPSPHVRRTTTATHPPLTFPSSRGSITTSPSLAFSSSSPIESHSTKFRLSETFLESFLESEPSPPFGFNGLGELVYQRTYSRPTPDGSKEQWDQTIERVVNGTFSMQKEWIKKNNLPWDEEKAQQTAQEMFERIYHMKFLPPGRGLWAMGSPITEERKMYAALNNCAFVSTKDMQNTHLVSKIEPFTFLMDASMLGVGVGFDTKGALNDIHVYNKKAYEVSTEANVLQREKQEVSSDATATTRTTATLKTRGATTSTPTTTSFSSDDDQCAAAIYTIPDSREGWVESLHLLLASYLDSNTPAICFDYSQVRPAGLPIKGFGGLTSGPGALEELHNNVHRVFQKLFADDQKTMTITSIVDIMNYIGKCVVAGNVRRTAEIAFGEPDNEEYIDLKDYSKNPDRVEHGWTSNNSVYAKLGMDYTDVCERIAINGEPGFAWLENMQAYSRMNGPPDHKDSRAGGGNPCLEQTLESHELCCLVETFPHNHESLEDYKRTLQLAFLYAKTVTLGGTHWEKTNRIMLRNRRIGTSMSGIAQFIENREGGLHELKTWMNEGYNCIQEEDAKLSEWLAIPRSIKTTSIKPSGTVSLLAGATPGMHYPESRFFVRRVRLSKKSELIPSLKEANYPLEPVVGDEENSYCVEIPVDMGAQMRTTKDISMWEQLHLASFLQEHWADNQVSCTVTFDPKKEAKQIAPALNYFQYKLKGVSLLPKFPMGAYPQMPYEEINEEEYNTRCAVLKELNFDSLETDENTVSEPEKFCDSGKY